MTAQDDQPMCAASYEVGDRVICHGYPGVVLGEYMPGMFEVRLASGVVVVPANELEIRG